MHSYSNPFHSSRFSSRLLRFFIRPDGKPSIIRLSRSSIFLPFIPNMVCSYSFHRQFYLNFHFNSERLLMCPTIPYTEHTIGFTLTSYTIREHVADLKRIATEHIIINISSSILFTLRVLTQHRNFLPPQNNHLKLEFIFALGKIMILTMVMCGLSAFNKLFMEQNVLKIATMSSGSKDSISWVVCEPMTSMGMRTNYRCFRLSISIRNMPNHRPATHVFQVLQIFNTQISRFTFY